MKHIYFLEVFIIEKIPNESTEYELTSGIWGNISSKRGSKPLLLETLPMPMPMKAIYV